MQEKMLKLYVKATTALKSDEGVTAVEYAIIVAIIAAAVAAGATILGPKIQGAFESAAGNM